MRPPVAKRIAVLRKQLEANLHDADRWMRLSELLHEAGDDAAAGEALFRGGALLARDGQVHKGVAMMKQGLVLAPAVKGAHEALGTWHAELQLNDEARMHFERALDDAIAGKDGDAAVRIITAIERLP